MYQRIPTQFIVPLAVLVLAACGSDDKPKASSQVLAKVNDAEITQQQLNYLITSQSGNGEPDKQKLLDQLVEQEVLVQKAAQMKLDRDPAVLQAIEFARRQSLAKAAAFNLIGTLESPTQPEMDAYYQQNPHLFAERRIFEFEAFRIDSAAIKPALQQSLDSSRNPADTRRILQTAGVPFAHTSAQRPGDRLPLEAVKQLANMQVGDVLVVPEGPITMLLQLKDSVPAPITRNDALPRIRSQLWNEDAASRVQSGVAALKSSAKVQYLQRFASATPVVPAPAATPANASPDFVAAGLKNLK